MAAQISIPSPDGEERELLAQAQKLSYSRASLGAWILECALRHSAEIVNTHKRAESIDEAQEIARAEIAALEKDLSEQISRLEQHVGVTPDHYD